MKAFMLALSALALVATPTAATAKQCRDAKGKFVPCADAKPAKCKDAQGRFAKCGSPGAKPA